ncbi:DUF6218 family protein [Umezawaea tangerina]|uniref:Uncharacterized protein n=1 Tax=Umezawaea tangerina TaxID=84725 RepID=A0A2T0TM71_9PSEU|nr:DUF6218 family protein [Umezawaea tangerina]PRY46749.1 hypothetical protein CLV43_1011029 [Umezawaea tangerina]
MVIDSSPAPLSDRAADERSASGHVVVCRCGDVVAVRVVDVLGERTAAWDAVLSGETARRALAECAGRALLAWESDRVLDVVRQLEEVAGVTSAERVVVEIPEVLAEIAEARAAYAEVVAEHQAGHRESRDLRWLVALPEPLPTTAEQLRRRARIVVAGGPETAEAELIASLGTWVVRRWQENVDVLERREYLRERFGPATVLPARWGKLVADA